MHTPPFRLKAPYNISLIDKCRRLKAKWSPKEKIWLIPGDQKARFLRLNYVYNSPLVDIKLTANREIVYPEFDVAHYNGHVLFQKKGLTRKPITFKGVTVLKGLVHFSGESIVITKGTTILTTVPRNILDEKDLFYSGWIAQVHETT